jgi:hypothetical protein
MAEADRIAGALKGVGWPYSNRSLVIREALGCLSDALRGKSAQGVFRYFMGRRVRRGVKAPRAARSRAASRNRSSA